MAGGWRPRWSVSTRSPACASTAKTSSCRPAAPTELALALPAVAQRLARAAARGPAVGRFAREPVPRADPMSDARRRPSDRQPAACASQRPRRPMRSDCRAPIRRSSSTRFARASGPSGGSVACCPARARCCSGFSPSPSTSRREKRSHASRPTASSPSSCRSPHSSSATQCSVPRSARACFTSPGSHRCPSGRSSLGRWLGGCIVALVTIVPACALAAVIAGDPGSAGRGGHRLLHGCGRLHRDLHRHRLHRPACRSVVARIRVPGRATARRGAHGHRAVVTDVGVTRRVRRLRRRRSAVEPGP